MILLIVHVKKPTMHCYKRVILGPKRGPSVLARWKTEAFLCEALHRWNVKWVAWSLGSREVHANIGEEGSYPPLTFLVGQGWSGLHVPHYFAIDIRMVCTSVTARQPQTVHVAWKAPVWWILDPPYWRRQAQLWELLGACKSPDNYEAVFRTPPYRSIPHPLKSLHSVWVSDLHAVRKETWGLPRWSTNEKCSHPAAAWKGCIWVQRQRTCLHLKQELNPNKIG